MISKQTAAELGLPIGLLRGYVTVEVDPHFADGRGKILEAGYELLMKTVEEKYPNSIIVKAEVETLHGSSGYHPSYGRYQLRLTGDRYEMPIMKEPEFSVLENNPELITIEQCKLAMTINHVAIARHIDNDGLEIRIDYHPGDELYKVYRSGDPVCPGFEELSSAVDRANQILSMSRKNFRDISNEQASEANDKEENTAKLRLITFEECRSAINGHSICLTDRDDDHELDVNIYYYPGCNKYQICQRNAEGVNEFVDEGFDLLMAIEIANKALLRLQQGTK